MPFTNLVTGGMMTYSANPTAVTTVQTELSTRFVKRGETLYYSGDSATSLYRLESGLMRALRLTPQGRNLTVRHIHPSDVFGEEVLHSLTRAHQVIALTDSVLVPIHPQHLSHAELWDVTRSLSTQL